MKTLSITEMAMGRIGDSISVCKPMCLHVSQFVYLFVEVVLVQISAQEEVKLFFFAESSPGEVTG